MFRPLLRSGQGLEEARCLELLEEQKRGVLSVNGDDGYPYAMPMNHFYCRENGKIYFHSGNVGHRLEAVKRSDKVCFCVHDEGVRKPGSWPLYFQSVIVFGRLRVVEDRDTVSRITAALSRKFTDDETYIQDEITKHLHRTVLLELTPEHICGKRVEES